MIDPVDFVRELHRTGVRYLLVGRQALVLHGAPLQSFDYDFYLEPSLAALKKVWKLARTYRMEITPAPPAAPLKLTLTSDHLKVDIFRAGKYGIQPKGFLVFAGMFQRKSVLRDKDFLVYVASLEDLKRSKLTRNSPKDREDIKYIESLLNSKRHG
ncbi:MAG: hypothetical protein NTV79_05560 [Candidatus Aureabacteria bacterium]|nr:hypothetical protein [Candidatus Auribacterota bacterium]